MAIVVLALSVTRAGAQDPRPREGEAQPARPRAESKWDRGQRKGDFNAAARPDSTVRPDGRVERKDPARAPEPKAEKWSRGQGDLARRFNDAANPNKNGSGDGTRPPPPPPAPRPRGPGR